MRWGTIVPLSGGLGMRRTGEGACPIEGTEADIQTERGGRGMRGSTCSA